MREWRIDTVDSSSLWKKDDAKEQTVAFIKKLEADNYVIVNVCRSGYAGSFDVISYREAVIKNDPSSSQ